MTSHGRGERQRRGKVTQRYLTYHFHNYKILTMSKFPITFEEADAPS